MIFREDKFMTFEEDKFQENLPALLTFYFAEKFSSPEFSFS
jgi:hypothetical protein